MHTPLLVWRGLQEVTCTTSAEGVTLTQYYWRERGAQKEGGRARAACLYGGVCRRSRALLVLRRLCALLV